MNYITAAGRQVQVSRLDYSSTASNKKMENNFQDQNSTFSNSLHNSLGLAMPSSHPSTSRNEYITDGEYEDFQNSGHHVNLHAAARGNQFAAATAPSLESSGTMADDQVMISLTRPSQQDYSSRRGLTYAQSDPSRSPEYGVYNIGPASMENNAALFGSNRSHHQDQNYLMTNPSYAGLTRSNLIRSISYSGEPNNINLYEEGEQGGEGEDAKFFSASSPESLQSFLRSPSTACGMLGSLIRDRSRESSSDSMSLLHGRKKRNKCSPEQYRQLEAFFARNRNPTGKIREELSKRIQMPERSVQVWFQNKRAKTKNDEIKEGVPLEKRTTVTRARMGRTISASDMQVKNRKSVNEPPYNYLVRRCVLVNGEGLRLWFACSQDVTNVSSGPIDPSAHEISEGVCGPLGQITLTLERPPQFYMEVFRSSGKAAEHEIGSQRASWRQCTDFTEGKQATSTLQHIVSGPFNELRHAAYQLYESSGSISTLIDFQDGGYLVDQQQQQQHHLHQQEQWEAATTTVAETTSNHYQSLPSDFMSSTGQAVDPIDGTMYQPVDLNDQEGSWPQGDYSTSRHQDQTTSLPLSLVPLSMSGESMMDLNTLRIETGGLNSSSCGDPSQHQLPDSQPDFHSLNWSDSAALYQYHQQPPLTSSTSWSLSSESQLHDSHSSFGSFSAPPYEVRGFALQQQQQQQQPQQYQHQQQYTAQHPNDHRRISKSYRSPTPTTTAGDHNQTDQDRMALVECADGSSGRE